jgi:hypothetical protein
MQNFQNIFAENNFVERGLRPSDDICWLRGLVRHRAGLIEAAATHI